MAFLPQPRVPSILNRCVNNSLPYRYEREEHSHESDQSTRHTNFNFFPVPMPPLPFIDPSTYTPGSFPYVDDGSQPVDRATWLAIFYESIPYFSDMARADTSVEDAEVKAGTFASTYREWLDGLASSPLDPSVKYSCLYLCKLREEALRKAGFRDIFRQIKVTENGNALKLLRGVCKELDALTDGSGVASEGVTANGVTSNGVAANGTTGQMIEKQETAWATVIRNILAGNIFDCGTAATRGDVFCFERSRSKLADRPWIVDDLDLFVRTMMTKTYRKALLFCDNSGPDFCLGMLPFARQVRVWCVVLTSGRLVVSIGHCLSCFSQSPLESSLNRP